MKPLNRKAYGSIAHLPGSRMDISDKKLHPGQVKIITERPRKGDVIIAQEKLDGSCCAVAKVDGRIVALTRAGYEAHTSPFKRHWIFDKYVERHADCFSHLLSEGERIVGEWLAMAHGIMYDLRGRELFVAFDIFTPENKRLPYWDFWRRCKEHQIEMPPLWSHSEGDPLPIPLIKKMCKESDYGGECAEGVVIRVEREGRVDFLAKYVRPGHECGKYFVDEEAGQEPMWNKFESGEYQAKEVVFDNNPDFEAIINREPYIQRSTVTIEYDQRVDPSDD